MNTQLAALLDNVASMQDPVLETHRFYRGYGNDPVNNKVYVELTIDYENGHMSVSPKPYVMTERHWNETYSRRDLAPYEFRFTEGKDPDKWGAVVRLIADAMHFGRARLTERYQAHPEKDPARTKAN